MPRAIRLVVRISRYPTTNSSFGFLAVVKRIHMSKSPTAIVAAAVVLVLCCPHSSEKTKTRKGK